VAGDGLKTGATFALAITVALVTAATPWLLERMTGEGRDLSFRVSDPIETKTVSAIAVEVNNGGSKNEDNVQVWIPFHASGVPKLFLNTEPIYSVQDDNPVISISTPIPAKAEIDEGIGAVVVSFERLRPDEGAVVSVAGMSNDSYIRFSRYGLDRVISDSVQAKKIEADLVLNIDKVFAYGFSILIAFVLLGVIISLVTPIDYQIESVEKSLGQLRKKRDKTIAKIQEPKKDT
jgi:hypothetical protein